MLAAPHDNATENVSVAVTCIREVPCSNFVQDIGCPGLGLPVAFYFPAGKFPDRLDQGSTNFAKI
jgi:hypothetical protein